MKIILYIFGIITILVLFQVQDKLRKPVFNRIHNVWNEDRDSILIANAIVVTMLIISFVLGFHM